MNFPNNINFEMNEFQRTIHSYTRRLKFTQSGLKTTWKKDIDGEKSLCDFAQGWVSSWMPISLQYSLKNFYNHPRLLKLEQSLKPVFGLHIQMIPPNLYAVLSWLLQNFLFCQRLPSSEQSRKTRKSHQKKQKQNCSGGGQTATAILN